MLYISFYIIAKGCLKLYVELPLHSEASIDFPRCCYLVVLSRDNVVSYCS